MYAHGETVVRLRGAVTTDRYGGEVWDWTAPTEVEIPGCGIAPRQSDEANERGRQGVIVGLTVYAPAGTDVSSSDRLRIRGDDHEVVGEIGVWHSPFTGWEPGVVINTTRVTG